ncbi:MAG: signal recognition particle-docking protein FtsY [Deltaproteobacteria bacterium]|nr:signal recognition particle-docking protein FtsY [Deltaproteobacteria bacterium]
MAIFRRKNQQKSSAAFEEAETPRSRDSESPAGPDGPVHCEENKKFDNNEEGVFKRLRHGLTKTRSSFTGRIDSLFAGKKEITESLMDELEEILFTSDIGVATTQRLLDAVREKMTRKALKNPQKLKEMLRDHILSLLNQDSVEHTPSNAEDPLVIMVAGVNGVGKTTSIGKIANRFRREGKTVMLVAADTFRAAAVEQLTIWGERVGATVVKQGTGADPSAVAFDAMTAAISRKIDVVLVDTAGRLHTQTNLMEELQKVNRVIGRKLPGAPHEVWLVLDATTGQNAISQAEAFQKALGLTGIILTKLDGTAKGGIVIGISSEFQIPIRFIGIGEQADDLRPFDPGEFVRAIFDG